MVASSMKNEACEGVVTRTSQLRPRPTVGGGKFCKYREGIRPAPVSKYHLLPVFSGVPPTLVRNARECHCSNEIHLSPCKDKHESCPNPTEREGPNRLCRSRSRGEDVVEQDDVTVPGDRRDRSGVERHMTVHVGHPVGRGQSHRVTYTSRHPENRTDTYRTTRDRTNFPLSAHTFGYPANRITPARSRRSGARGSRHQHDRRTTPAAELAPPFQSGQRVGHSDPQRHREVPTTPFLHLDHTASPGAVVAAECPDGHARIHARTQLKRMIAQQFRALTAPQSPRAATPTTLAWQQQVEQTGTEFLVPHGRIMNLSTDMHQSADIHQSAEASARQNRNRLLSGQHGHLTPAAIPGGVVVVQLEHRTRVGDVLGGRRCIHGGDGSGQVSTRQRVHS